ncbi:MAG TPA: hypothetical protein VEJ87_08155 [Acidimicrobiales bacterium]|nr:hypothetical protein [Acidimicrobiales bacterium]
MVGSFATVVYPYTGGLDAGVCSVQVDELEPASPGVDWISPVMVSTKTNASTWKGLCLEASLMDRSASTAPDLLFTESLTLAWRLCN